MERQDGTNARGPESGGIEEVERELEEDLDDPATYLRHLCDQPEPLRRDEIRDLAESILEERATLRAELEAVRRERDEWKAKHDTLADVSRSCIATAERERDAARAEREALRRHYDEAGPEHNLLALLDLYDERRAAAESERDEARAERDARPALATLPTEFVAGEWIMSGQAEPDAVVTYTRKPGPETEHVGWCWWARGKMGESRDYMAARGAAEHSLIAHAAKVKP